jgi:hypothetical protein
MEPREGATADAQLQASVAEAVEFDDPPIGAEQVGEHRPGVERVVGRQGREVGHTDHPHHVAGREGSPGRVDRRVRIWQHRSARYVCNTPVLNSGISGLFAAAIRQPDTTSRVFAGSMMPSTHSRAAAYRGSIARV